MKNRAEILVKKLRPNIVLERLQQYILVNFIIKLLVLRDYDLILVVCGKLLKILYFIIITENFIAKELAKLFKDNMSYTSPLIWKLHLCGVIIQAHLPRQPPFSQYVLGQCCNPPGIPSSMAGILLFNSVFHNRVTPVSVSTLKPLLRVIEVLLLKL